MRSLNATLDQLAGVEIAELLQRDDIMEIYVNDDGFLRYKSLTEGKRKTELKLEPEKVRAIIELITGQAHKVVNGDIPSVSTEITGYGCRFQGELPPIVRFPQFNIRKKATRIFTFADYVADGELEPFHRDYLEKAIKERKNILVVGGTGTGKTTFLNAVLEAIARISPDHRIISLEDLPELQCPADDYSPMFTMQDAGAGGVRYNMTRLLADCMRRSPDRIVIGEVRDGAAYTMLKAWNTGHPGGACTVHANDAVAGLSRIKSLAQEDPDASNDLKELIGQAIDVVLSIVHTTLPNGLEGRRINQVIEVEGYDSISDKYIFKDIKEDNDAEKG